ncbi:unnamed protein product, partial [marine sediment metagenome]
DGKISSKEDEIYYLEKINEGFKLDIVDIFSLLLKPRRNIDIRI